MHACLQVLNYTDNVMYIVNSVTGAESCSHFKVSCISHHLSNSPVQTLKGNSIVILIIESRKRIQDQPGCSQKHVQIPAGPSQLQIEQDV